MVFIITCIIFGVFGCEGTKEQLPTENTVTFFGNFNAGDLVHYYTTKEVVDFSQFVKRIETDSVYFFEEEVGEFVEMQLNNEEGWGVIYLCFPGDTIEIVVTGKNSYRLRSDDPIRQNELDFQYTLDSMGSVMTHRLLYDQRSIDSLYHGNIELLQAQYEDGNVSDRFYRAMEIVLRSTHITQSVLPALIERTQQTGISIDSLFELLPHNDRFLPLGTYNRALSNLINASLYQQEIPLTKSNVLDEVNKRYEGRIRDYVLTAYVRSEINDNTFDYEDEELMVNSINDAVYRDVMLESYTRKVDQDSELVAIDDRRLKLSEVINTSLDTVVYVDFWATWCAPCIVEMKYYPEMLERHAGDKVKFLFLSMDTDVQAWQKGVKRYPFMDETNSFIISDPTYAQIVKDLNVNSIPRYVVFQEGEILVFNAPRPGKINSFADFFPANREE